MGKFILFTGIKSIEIESKGKYGVLCEIVSRKYNTL
jgi:hypothetical protein